MIKQLILLVQVLGLFFYQLIFTGDLTVVQKVPGSLTQGKETVIEITIKKEDVTGFAKVQQIFPEGFTVGPVETKGATFSFKDNKVKFIWMALPVEKEFTISYKVTPNQTTSGEFTLGGKFSFIDESERKNIEIPEAKFSVIAEDLITEEVAEEPIEEPIEEELTDETTAITEEVPIEKPTEETAVVTINCKRTIENIGEGKYKVVVEIDKKGVEGFAKITEQIPAGFTASENDSKGGVFSYKENDAKILWMSVPKEDVYTISYTLEVNETTVNGSYAIKGYYSYLDNDITSKYDIDESSFDLAIDALVAEEPVIEAVVTEAVPVVAEIVPEETETVIEEPVVETPIADVTSTPNPDHGVTYKVQVGAGHKTVPSTYFKTKFNLKDNVSTMNHEGWIKYLVGSFNEYKLARDKRNTVRNNVKTAFVTAYNTGTRITVQEALMISRQKWYK